MGGVNGGVLEWGGSQCSCIVHPGINYETYVTSAPFIQRLRNNASVDEESSDIGQDTDSVISEATVTCLGACCKPGHIDPNQPRTRDVLDAMTKTIHSKKVDECFVVWSLYLADTLRDHKCFTLPLLCWSSPPVSYNHFPESRYAFVSSGFSRWNNALECIAKQS